MKRSKRILRGIMVFILIMAAIFAAGRFGWKLAGFRGCQAAGIEQVTVTDNQVRIKGFYPGSFPEGFLGYYAKEEDGKLYVGYRFSAVFGIFENGSFEISIPTQMEIREVYMKTAAKEELLWPVKEDTDNGVYGK